MTRSNKQFAVIVIVSFTAIVILALLLSALTGDRQTDPDFKRPSTFFTDSSGGKAIYLLLEQFLPRTSRLTRPYISLKSLGPDTTLIVMGPTLDLSVREMEALEQWLASGGQLILAAGKPWPIKEPAGLFQAASDETEDAEPSDFMSRNSMALIDHEGLTEGPLMLAEKTVVPGKGASPYLKVGDTVLVAQKLVGAGRILFVPDSLAWSNKRLRETGNAVWLIEQCLAHGDGSAVFDEYHQSFQEKQRLGSLIVAFLFSSWGAAFLQLILAGLLLILGPARRFGSPLEPKPAAPGTALELIQARADFLKTARATTFGFEMIHQMLIHRLTYLGRINLKNYFNDKPKADDDDHLSRYHALLFRFKTEDKINEPDFIEAARLSGKILEEYQHDRQIHN